jgi:amino acid adenylation domain-containing protein
MSVLRVTSIGVHDNFFELGGHSLLATRLLARVRATFNVAVPLRQLFSEPTIAALAAHLELLLKNGEWSAPPPLTRVSRAQSLPLSFAQQRLWFIDQLEPMNAFYNIPVAVRLSGALDQAALEGALTEVVRRHEVLRTQYTEVDGEPVQVITAAAAFSLSLTDLSHLAQSEREAEAKVIASAEAGTGFDLRCAPLLRARLLRLSADEHVVLLTMHHISSDGWSVAVLLKEVAALYDAFTQGLASPLPELVIQYADFSVWQREWLQGEVLAEQLSYWQQQLGTDLPMLELPTDRARPPVQSYHGATQSLSLSEAVSRQLLELSRREGVTLFMTLLAAFQTLLARYTGQTEIVVGTPVAGRQQAETEELIGFFINTLVLRTDLSGDPTFVEMLGRVREVALSAYTHQDVPFEKLVEELEPERSLSHSPLFQVMVVLQNTPVEGVDVGQLEMRGVGSESRVAKFDLTLTVVESAGVLRLFWNYRTDLFDAVTIERMSRHFERVLESMVKEPQQRVSAIALLTEAETEQQLNEWNATTVEYPANTCLHEMFEEQVERTPDQIAVVYDEQQVSYAELNERANQLAHYLRQQGVGAEVLVGILMERSVEMVVALMGVLKAGGAYLPLDSAYPQERLALMLEDAHIKLVLGQRELIAKLPHTRATVLCLDEEWASISSRSGENPQLALSPENLAYVIYTSGSTGTPKAAMNTHAAITNRLLWMQDAYQLEQTDRVLQKTPFSFDVSVWEFFWPLLTGARLVMAEPGGHQDSAYLVKLVNREQITTLHFVPSMLQVFLGEANVGECRSLKRVICSGEALSPELAQQFFERFEGVELDNLYGPTEAAVDVTFHECEPDSQLRTVPIGRPIANTQLYLLDGNLRPVPVGVSGHLHIGGRSLARGYLRRPELTAEKFIPNPFSVVEGGRLYRTGDLARYLPDGEIEYLGRNDEQVKLRGFRIELGEIEAVLRTHDGVSESVVVVREMGEGRGQQLVGYVVMESAEQRGSAEERGRELQEYVSGKVPQYMVPTWIVVLDEMPLTTSGKINRRALPAPIQGASTTEDYVAPRNAVEEVLAGIYRQVLGERQIGIHDNFFQLGGHSLLATQVIARVRKSFQAEVPLIRLFESPTVAALAVRIEAAIKTGHGLQVPFIERVSREVDLPLSFAQERLWFINQLEPDSAAYNVPLAVRLKGPLNIEALEQTLSEIVRRHEVLRTTFSMVEGRPVQVIAQAEPLILTRVDLSELSEAEREIEVKRLAAEDVERPLRLAHPPLLRASVVKLTEEDHVVLLTTHHIVSDNWSMGVLTHEVAMLYGAFSVGKESPLPELPLQYADFACWQRNWLQGDELETQLSYWRKQLGGILSPVKLPIDRRRTAAQTFRGASQTLRLPQALTDELRKLSQQEGVTLFMTMLAGFQTLLHLYKGQEDILIGSPIANRTQIETEGLIGFFVNMIVLRTDLSGNPTFRELLGRVREVTLGAYTHQDLPFERLVQELRWERDLSRQPLFQAVFALQNAPTEVLELPGLTLSQFGTETNATRFDLMVTASGSEEQMVVSFHYDIDLFDAATITRMRWHFEKLLGSIVAQPDARLKALDMLSEAEHALIDKPIKMEEFDNSFSF